MTGLEQLESFVKDNRLEMFIDRKPKYLRITVLLPNGTQMGKTGFYTNMLVADIRDEDPEVCARNALVETRKRYADIMENKYRKMMDELASKINSVPV